LERRNATAAVIGAGDFIGSAIARKLAAEGFSVFAGRRNGEKLAPLVHDIEAKGGRVVARSLDARSEDGIAAFLRAADDEAPVAALLELVVVLGLLLLPLVHAARTPTESATAPSAAAFLENQGRGALTPGSSFLIAHASRNRARRMAPSAHPFGVMPAGSACCAKNATK